MEDDTCINEHELEVVASMANFGIVSDLRVRSMATAQSVSVSETYQLPTSRFPVGNGTVIALEPAHNHGIYRPIPQNTRVVSFTVTPMAVPLVALHDSARLTVLFVTDPYATSAAPDARVFPCIVLAAGTLTSAQDACIPLRASTSGSYNAFAELGVATPLSVLTPTVGGVPTPLFSTEPRYPAVRFTCDVPALFPPEVDILVTVSYEVTRSV